ncbi:DUF1684 domain-containing protein [Subtercola lobariae]|uniref:DUF1684 domain-containing protein n=1 Tax=Subtercola lobariae TaxID=1588641 RepID=A0A917B426_9MICO|nr:DUF1684 domain-containing protein [Subtercola lobariae]GGF22077.1 hypothetical protein GCM10011399_14730 [Subtercola lobariae]
MTLTEPTTPVVDRPEFEAAWYAWRAQNEERRRDAYGFLSYAAVYKLGETAQRFAEVPGAWSVSDEGVVVELSDEERLTVDEDPVHGRFVFAPVAEREFRRDARFDEVVVELSKRGGITLLRPIDPAHGLRESYVETPAFAPDPRWIVRGEYVPFEAPRDTAIDAAIDGITHQHDALGEVVFDLDGTTNRLLFLAGGAAGGGAFAVFTDGTSGVSTYRASRRIAAELPAEGGPIELDFNRTGNLQCAYTNYSPCPLAPAQNRLVVAIEAGEKTPVFAD